MKLGIIGSPVQQSLSPTIHQYIGRCMGIQLDYARLETQVHELPQRLDWLVDNGYTGVNVTAPLKLVCAKHLIQRTHAFTPTSVNTIRFGDGGIGSTNTDVTGFSRLWKARRVQHVAVLGTGGVVHSVLQVLQKIDIPKVTLFGRSVHRIAHLTDHLEKQSQWSFGPYSDFKTSAKDFDAIVHCLPSAALATSLSLPYDEVLPSTHFVDLNYGQSAAQLRGCPKLKHLHYEDGMSMLVGQAISAFEFWTQTQTPSSLYDDLCAYLSQINVA